MRFLRTAKEALAQEKVKNAQVQAHEKVVDANEKVKTSQARAVKLVEEAHRETREAFTVAAQKVKRGECLGHC